MMDDWLALAKVKHQQISKTQKFLCEQSRILLNNTVTDMLHKNNNAVLGQLQNFK